MLFRSQKKAGFPCSGLNAGSYFISQDEGMTESPVETLENAIPGIDDGQGSLACCSPWGRKELDMTE